ncbi:MAG TPA: hypothetical protein VFU23_05240 [Gemmatimonadales bacterium]|nr:hypothetical protein [Gemmatimonadales bacterium]
MSRLLPLLLVAVILPAGLAAQDSTHKETRIKRNPDLISEQEIQAAPDAWQTAFALVEQLRPNWLRQHGISSIRSTTPVPQVYVGGVRRGGIANLEDVQRASIKEIQHLRGTDATQRYGSGHESGAILVILR